MNRSDRFQQIRDIADDVFADTATQAQATQLEQLLAGDFAAQEFFYDYLSMHMHMLSPEKKNLELTFRRLTTTTAEELVLRPFNGFTSTETNDSVIREKRLNNKWIVLGLLALVLIILSIIWGLVGNSDNAEPIVGNIVSGQLERVSGRAGPDKDAVYPGLYRSENGASIKLLDGDTLHIGPKSRLKLFNNNEVRVVHGSFTFDSATEHHTLIHNRRFITYSYGSGITIDSAHKNPKVITSEKSFINPVRWRPVHYWSFEDKEKRYYDSAGSNYAQPSTNLPTVPSIAGQAVDFSNSKNAVIEIDSGGGTVAGTGSFAVDDGITIEALIRLKNTDDLGQQEIIFAQSHGENNPQILLSIQRHKTKAGQFNNNNGSTSVNFGLFLLGQGFQELSAVFKQSDDSLVHVAATYDVKTGLKTIYINGKKLASHHYPAGSKVVSGGSGLATIGNSPTESLRASHAFQGEIDEVAFYDFALPEYSLALHQENIAQGMNYFGLPVSTALLPTRIRIKLPPNSVVEIDDITGLPSKLLLSAPKTAPSL